MTHKRLRVAVPVPVGDGFDYRWEGPGRPPPPGTRIRVPFGRGQRIGIVVEARTPSGVDDAALREAREVLDPEPLFAAELLASLEWAAGYYHHPLGEVLSAALPGLLRRGRPLRPPPEPAFTLTDAAAEPDELARRAPRQAEALKLLARSGIATTRELAAAGITRDTVRRLEARGLVRAATASEAAAEPAGMPIAAPAAETATDGEPRTTASEPEPAASPPELTADQRAAVDSLLAARGFTPALLFGVTGSGKTEVFLRLIRESLDRGRQCLLLVPEIGLTPQLVRRLRERFGGELAVFHSGLAAGERLRAWRETQSGRARLIVGTRSAAFAPLRDPGLIVVDEEHDPSYKQQSGFRYSGRDLAIVRARALDIPVVLASATPSLESFRNAAEGRYRLLGLPRRIGSGGNPAMRTIDLNRHAVRHGLSTPLLAAMDRHLGQGRQVLLFINRRGFAPALFCPGCETTTECDRCDARMTVHSGAGQIRCHHCGRTERLRWACPACGGERIAVGAGTERITTEIEALYPELAVARLDRDAVTGREALGQALARIESGEARIIVGTQLLTKGHDFPDVTLVGVLNADQGLFGTDFRSEERLAQTIVQVAGRAGRREQRGEVLIQTHYPGHPLLERLLSRDYGAFAEHALAERRATGWPPYSHLAVFRAEAASRDRVFALLNRLRRHCMPEPPGLRVLGPTSDWMERREGRYRAQLLLRASDRQALHATIAVCVEALMGWRESRRLRWSIDVDPAEL
jgi:primosomal protein N' (replication factor Y)